MSWYRFHGMFAATFPLLVSATLLACGGGDDASTGDGDGDGDVTSPTGGTGTGGASGGNETGGTTGGTSTGATSSGGSSSGGTNGGNELDGLLAEALEGCQLLDMDVHVLFTGDGFTANIDGRVTDGSLMTDGSSEILAQESIAGDKIELSWEAGVADGARVPVNGWVEQNRETEDNRYRCFDGDVQVRLDDRGDLFYVFAATTVYEATADGTCGAATSGEEAFGCLPADF